MGFRFGRHFVDEDRTRLLRDGGVVPLEPKVFEVLRYLVAHHERVVTKDELLDHVWKGEAVTEAVLPNNVAVLRKALGQVRGESEPIETVHGRGYRFSAAVVREGVSSALDGQGADDGALVGRGPVLARLQARLTDARAGRGRLVLLSGPAGVGKTCLAEELTRRAAAAGDGVWSGRCHEGDGAPALWPWLQVLRACSEDLGRDGLQRLLGRERALLEPWLGEGSAAEHGKGVEREADAQRFQRLDALASFLTRAAAERTRLVWIDDAHLADAASLQMLEQLAGQLARSRILVLVTLRADELPHLAADREPWLKLFRLRAAEHVELEGLSESDAASWLASLHGKPLAPSLLRALWRATDGNPYFMRDALNGLAQEGRGASGFELRLSSSAHELLRHRFRGLPEPLVQLLKAAAVIGFELNLALLQRLALLPNEVLLDVLDDATELGILQPLKDEAGGYRFCQRLLRHALYAELTSSRRAQLHLLAAGALAEHAAGAADQLRQVAHHLHRALPAVDAAQAVDYATRAAVAAERGGAHLDAAAMYGLALEAVAYELHADGLRRCRLQVRQGRALALAGHHGRARATLQGALDGARRAQDATALAEAAQALAELASDPLCTPLVVQGVLRETLGALQPHDEPLRSTLLGLWAGTRIDDPDAATRAFGQALTTLSGSPGWALMRQRVEHARVAYILQRSEHAACVELARSLAQAAEALQLAGAAGSPGEGPAAVEALGCDAQRLLCTALVLAGETAAFERVWGAWGSLAQRGQQPAQHAAWAIFGAEHALACGRLTLSATRAAAVDALGLPLDEGSLGFWRATFRIRHGMLCGQPFPDRAELEQLEARLERGDDWRRVVLAWLAARAGGREVALRLLDECLPSALARVVALPWELCALSECVARVGHREGALVLRGALEAALARAPVEQALGPLFQFFGSPQRHMAVLEQFLGRSDRARARLETAVDANARMGLATHAVGCRTTLAQLLIESGPRKLHARGVRLLEAATAEASALGITVRDAPVVTGTPDPDEVALH